MITLITPPADVGAVLEALRAAQHLDALDVLERHVAQVVDAADLAGVAPPSTRIRVYSGGMPSIETAASSPWRRCCVRMPGRSRPLSAALLRRQLLDLLSVTISVSTGASSKISAGSALAPAPRSPPRAAPRPPRPRAVRAEPQGGERDASENSSHERTDPTTPCSGEAARVQSPPLAGRCSLGCGRRTGWGHSHYAEIDFRFQLTIVCSPAPACRRHAGQRSQESFE